MIIFAWADPDNLRTANDFVKARREPCSAGVVPVNVALYSTQEEAPLGISNRLVRVQVRADWVGDR